MLATHCCKHVSGLFVSVIDTSFVSEQSDDGTDPVRKFESRLNTDSRDKAPKVEGTDPNILFELRYSHLTY